METTIILFIHKTPSFFYMSNLLQNHSIDSTISIILSIQWFYL